MSKSEKFNAVVSLVTGTMAMSLAMAMSTENRWWGVIIWITASVLLFTNAVLILYRDQP